MIGRFFLPVIVGMMVIPLALEAQEVETLNKYRRMKLAEEYYEKGIDHFENGEYEASIEDLSVSIQLDPNNYLSYYFSGDCFRQLGEHDKALRQYNLSLSLKPDFSEGLFSRGVLLYEMQHYKSAITDFEELLELPVGETQAIYFRGIRYGESDQDTGFDELITTASNHSDIYQYLGQCHRALENYGMAIKCMGNAIALRPEEDNYYVNRGLVYLMMGRKDSAEIDFQKALSLNPGNDLARINLSIAREEKKELSITSLNAFIERHPNLSYGYANRAYYYFQRSNYEKALMDYQKALQLEPGNYEYLLDRGLTYEKLNRLELAIRDYRAASELEPAAHRVWTLLGNVYYKKDDFERSITYYDRALALQPGEGHVLYNRGLAHFYAGFLEKACQDMEMAFQQNVRSAARFLELHCR